MGATEALLTWGGLPALPWIANEEESIPRLQANDAVFEDLHRQLIAALAEAEQGRAREAALLRRAEKSEEAEEALASQMAELEAEAFARITQVNKLLAAGVEPVASSQLSMQVEELDRRLQASLEEAVALAQKCEVLEEELEQGRIRETAFRRRAEIAEEAEEALASQMAELEAEAFTRITEDSKLLTQERIWLGDERCHEETESIVRSEVAELKRRLAEAGEELEAVNAKLRQAEEKNRSLEMCLAQEGEKAVTLKRKQSDASEETVVSLSLQDLAGFVNLKLWSPSSLKLQTSCR